LHPVYFVLKDSRSQPCPRGLYSTSTWAGLLALGSSYLPRLPISLERDSGEFAAFVPDDSGGTAPDFHGIPY